MKKFANVCRCWFALVLVLPVAKAEVRLPAVFGNNMVLQRDLLLPVWGWAEPGEKVSVTLEKSTVSASTDSGGKWIVKLPAMKAGGPYTMTVAGKNTISITDILIGEVWICSGQSNMERALVKSANGAEVVAQATNPKIRLFHIPNTWSAQPASDVKASWQNCTPETAAEFSAAAYFFGREINKELDVPVGLIESSWGGTPITPWINSKTGKAPEETRVLDHCKFGRLFNGMINPLIPFGIRGAIWYQGEANNLQRDGMKYLPKMKDLITGWRAAWGQGDFPFYYVQLPPWNYTGYRKKVTALDLAEFRQAQLGALTVPNTGMIVTTDIGGGLHPANKQDVGKRLALWAFAKTYGKKDVICSGPLYKSFKVEGNKIRVSFDYAEGMKSRDGQNLNWFQIAGDDRHFYEAKAVVDGETIIVSNDQVTKPVAVRFGADQLAKPNLVNKAGLPASPFMTDDWPQEAVQIPAADEAKPTGKRKRS